MLLWFGFILCTAVIVYSGSKLSRYGDIIAEKTGLGKTWIGIVLLASVTSLPELITGISSVTYAGVPDIAIGDVLGSCVFNMLILACLDVFYRPEPISTRAHQGLVLSAGFGILLISLVSAGIFLGESLDPIGWVGLHTLLIVVIYFVAMRLIYTYEKRQISAYMKGVAIEMKYRDITLRATLINYSVNAVVVIFAAVLLPKIGESIAVQTGLGQTFVGNVFIALSTSLPEVVVSYSAIRMDAINLAIGNLFGSNIFNIMILAIDDFFFVQGPLLSFADMNHLISAMTAIIMTTIAIIGLTYSASRKPLPLAWDSLGIVLMYITNLLLLYMLK